jgi:hypothetical protein
MNMEVDRLFGDDTALERIFRWDSRSGDCSASHLIFKERLEHDSRLTVIKWEIIVSGEYAMITGESLYSKRIS